MSRSDFLDPAPSMLTRTSRTASRAAKWRLSYRAKISVATCVALVVLWWALARLAVVPPMFLPGPFDVMSKMVDVSLDGFQGATLWEHLAASLMRVSVALGAAFVVGVGLGFAAALNQTASGMIDPILELYRPIPPLAYLPLVIIWCGIGEFAKIFVIFLGILPSITIATGQALRSIAQDKVDAARALGATRLQIVALVLFPHALPGILTGTRIGLGTGWATLVAAELVAATQGLGFMIKGAADFLVTDVVILGILVIAAVAIAMDLALRGLQRLLSPWQGHE